MTRFVRNSGQWPDDIAAVARISNSKLWTAYRGAGPYWASVNTSGEVLSISKAQQNAVWLDDVADDDLRGDWEMDDATNVEPGVFRISCWGSCYDLVVDRWTAAAGVLAALGLP